ncbi:TrkA family potassium uptake protein [Carboxydocella sp. ULO1]|uniref:potassium channel family protein n=1 Tax=Carboxydocella sp. ULO1 TaxID=1926599 RepID=UPI0009AC4D49|nr:potassium channel protein [Carboxydocella sp. ULO1]
MIFVSIFLGTIGYMLIEDYSLRDALWMTTITLTTVGYGLVKPLSVPGTYFTIFLSYAGLALILYALGLIGALIVEGDLFDLLGRRKMKQEIAKLRDHIIVCGAGRVGKQVIERLKKERTPFVVIEQKEHLFNSLLEEGVLAILGDASMEEVLRKAGIERAKGLVSAIPGDANNVFVTLTAKEINPGITIVARAERKESEAKLYRAGADKVVSPAIIGGQRMAISIIKPASVDFVDTLVCVEDVELEIEELLIADGSVLVNKDLKNSGIREKTGTMVVAIQREGKLKPNPGPEELLQSGDILIAIGTRQQLQKLEELACGRCKI